MIRVTPTELIARGLWERACLFLHTDVLGVRYGTVDPNEVHLMSYDQAGELFPGSVFAPAELEEVRVWSTRYLQ